MAVLPQQVQQQLEEAERIQASMTQPTPPSDPAAQDDPPPAEPNPAPAEPAPAAEPVEPAKDAAYWEHRFKTVDGMAKAERARMEETLRAQSEQLRQTTAFLESMRSQPQQPQPPALPEQPLVTSKDEATFGTDLVDMARRVARDESRVLEKRLAGIEASIKALMPQLKRVEQVERTVAQTTEDRFWSELSNAVPDFEAVNADQAWLKWLSEYDPVAGCTRNDSLLQAQKALDHRRVIGLFKLFKQSVTPPAQPQPTPNKSKAELARQVAPAKNSTVTVPPQQKRMYSGEDYAYWLDPRRVNDTDTPKIQAMRAELDQALAEGRIQF